MKLRHPQISLDDIKVQAANAEMVVYGAVTCWWHLWPSKDMYTVDNAPNGLPCDPRGGVLMQTNDVMGFIQQAEQSPEHYGKHGIDAFVASYHGNVLTDDDKPTCFSDWGSYNNLLDL